MGIFNPVCAAFAVRLFIVTKQVCQDIFFSAGSGSGPATGAWYQRQLVAGYGAG